jgi:hypothetical protein
MIVALVVSLATQPPSPEKVQGLILWDTNLWQQERRWIPTYGLLLLYFVGMMVLCLAAPGILSQS